MLLRRLFIGVTDPTTRNELPHDKTNKMACAPESNEQLHGFEV